MGEKKEQDRKQLERYRILYKGGTGEIVEKKSRFIACTRPVSSEEEALAFVEEIRKKYWDARHHCWAYVIGERGEQMRCSDDGEPSQTAGKPMLDVLLGSEIRNICLVVTRYFGGILLGTGGLVRAYQGAAKAGLENSVAVEKQLAEKVRVTTDYNGVGKIQYLAAQAGIMTLESEYTDKVQLVFLAPEAEMTKFRSDITEGTGGRAKIESEGWLYYGMLGKEVLLF